MTSDNSAYLSYIPKNDARRLLGVVFVCPMCPLGIWVFGCVSAVKILVQTMQYQLL